MMAMIAQRTIRISNSVFVRVFGSGSCSFQRDVYVYLSTSEAREHRLKIITKDIYLVVLSES